MTIAQPTSWVEWATYNLPQRMCNYGLSSQFTGICFIAPMDVQWQALAESILIRSQLEPTNTDDELPYLGQEAGLPQYSTETNAEFRTRITNKWQQWVFDSHGNILSSSQGVWQKSATPTGVLDQLSQAGFPAGLYNAVIDVNLPGGGDNGVTNPADPSFSPEYAGTGIPPYPASVPIWWSQFILILYVAAPLGTGASSGGINNQGQLISQDQLLAIQLIINKFKPANWACREFVVMYLPSSGTVIWDQLLTSSFSPSSASYLYDYDISGITWGASASLPPGDIIEHYPVSNYWRYRPMFPGTQS